MATQENLIELIIYPMKKVLTLLLSMQVGPFTIGFFVISAIILSVIYKILLGDHIGISSRFVSYKDSNKKVYSKNESN